MSKVFEFLSEMEENLKRIPDVKTVGIGLEKGLGAKDCPFIRIVHESNSNSGQQRGSCDLKSFDEMTVQVVFGLDLKGDMRDLYEAFFDLEEQIRIALIKKYKANGVIRFKHTVTDEDRLPAIKASISRFEIVGIR